MSPADIVKVRLQCQVVPMQPLAAGSPKPKYRGPVHCLLTIAREEGVLGLYKGAQALALRDGPSFATYFTIYNVICEQLSPPGQTRPGMITALCISIPHNMRPCIVHPECIRTAPLLHFYIFLFLSISISFCIYYIICNSICYSLT